MSALKKMSVILKLGYSEGFDHKVFKVLYLNISKQNTKSPKLLQNGETFKSITFACT